MPDEPMPDTMSARTVLTTTRAVRRRLDLERPVDRRLIEDCVAVAAQAPSGGNRRGFRFVVVDDPGVRASLAEIYQKAFEIYRNGPTVVTKAFEGDDDRTRVQARIFESVEHLAVHLAEIPCLVIPVVPGRWETRTDTRAQAGLWGSGYPAVWSFMLAARTHGLGTALTTMHLEFEEETAALLGLPFDEYTQLGLVPLAHTIGTEFRPAAREPASSFIHWDGWGDEKGN